MVDPVAVIPSLSQVKPVQNSSNTMNSTQNQLVPQHSHASPSMMIEVSYMGQDSCGNSVVSNGQLQLSITGRLMSPEGLPLREGTIISLRLENLEGQVSARMVRMNGAPLPSEDLFQPFIINTSKSLGNQPLPAVLTHSSTAAAGIADVVATRGDIDPDITALLLKPASSLPPAIQAAIANHPALGQSLQAPGTQLLMNLLGIKLPETALVLPSAAQPSVAVAASLISNPVLPASGVTTQAGVPVASSSLPVVTATVTHSLLAPINPQPSVHVAPVTGNASLQNMAAKAYSHSGNISAGGLPPMPTLGQAVTANPVVMETPTLSLPASSPVTVNGTVMATTSQGMALVQTPLGLLLVEDAGGSFVKGAQVEMQLRQVIPANAGSQASAFTTSPLTPQQLMGLGKGWPAFDEYISVLKGLDVNPASIALALQSLPVTGGKMAAGILFFMMALKNGQSERIVSDGLSKQLESTGHKPLIERLVSELRSFQPQFSQTPDNGWQMFLVPLLHEGKMETLRMFVRPDGQDQQGGGSAEDGEKGTRFVVEVDFSHFGEMQMDGLVRKRDKATAFDLMVRSYTPLPATMQNDIRRIFEEAAGITGFKGGVQFQHGAPFPVQPMEDLPQEHVLPEVTA